MSVDYRWWLVDGGLWLLAVCWFSVVGCCMLMCVVVVVFVVAVVVVVTFLCGVSVVAAVAVATSLESRGHLL